MAGAQGNARSASLTAKEVTAMADVDTWLHDAGAALGVDAADVLPEEIRDQMLGLTGDIARRVVRVAVPWTSYLMGVAVGRGATPEEALRLVAEALPPAPPAE
jgi:hypothetical protein